MQNLCVVLTFVLLLSCQTTPQKEELKPAPPDAKTQLVTLQHQLEHGRERSSVPKLKALAIAHPGTDVSDTAWTLIGRAHLQRREYKSAAEAYLQVLNATTQTAHEEEAYVGATKALAQTGRADEALSLSNKALASGKISPAGQLELQRLRYPLLSATGDVLASLKALVAVHDGEPDAVQREILKNKSFEIANKLERKELETVVNDSGYSFVRGFAAYRLGTYNLEQHDLDSALANFQKTLEYTPNTNVSAQAAAQIQQIEGRRQVDPYMIGVVLPLTGKYGGVSQKTLRGLQLGLGIYGGARSQFKLAIVDSEASPDEAERGVERLVDEDHAIAIVGSLLSRTSVPVATKANELGVPNIALSQKAGITEIGNLVFRNAVTSEMQVQYLVKVAMEDMGMRKFAILFPNDTYGVEYSNLFWNEVEKRGGTVVGVQPYNPSETDFRAPVKRLVGTYYLEDRQAEFKERLKAWFKGQKNPGSVRTTAPEDLLPPIVDFDGLFVPDGPKAMGQIAPMLAYVGVGNVRFLGTNLWNSPEFLRRGQKDVENALFVDSEVTTDPRFASSKFYTDFKQVFGTEPGFFELQGYETGLLLNHLISDGERSRLGLAERLTKQERVQGVLGPMQMSPARELIWPMTALTVRDGAIVPVVKPRTSSL